MKELVKRAGVPTEKKTRCKCGWIFGRVGKPCPKCHRPYSEAKEVDVVAIYRMIHKHWWWPFGGEKKFVRWAEVK